MIFCERINDYCCWDDQCRFDCLLENEKGKIDPKRLSKMEKKEQEINYDLR